ncbi:MULTISPECIES: 1-deoxy-D-xylulose-5-phosphate reductoisomerase [unclassified Candidatus Frackibacter]|uniref:1-deoxy-D-xylulose-5-phosphate reductoisomerase n=1 Tax=unclassified Candidatus Frackibacter TaxID=2648818 RepID=UPI000888E9BC|nr:MULTISPECIES: 1-deoxy-D-xylulose-5-phosphate reductoisomerase [unclassified Candidatus Frackibacter]SDB98737.1 1-deoxy-D-xylulose 5-phosphate reductoisomerase [Candidatus Frackibacter sp. WG11]SEM30532.1 1-deoxy-D-xylulose 5-phosphate reductoisomerase [Candidatus Frackibacter sp. WG12]SFL35450.1 1-deoxy-D-xylulose 5-phosphate reductoisomerase [Candidatus Frackibacter sp. WG13]
MKAIAILGSTGSIGTQTLEVIRNLELDCEIIALTANSNIEKLEAQAREFEPQFAVLMNEEAAKELEYKLSDLKTEVLVGQEGLVEVSTYQKVDLVINSVVGAAGLVPTLEAIKAKKNIGLANKETLVTAGELVMSAAEEYGVQLLPIDSEHNAIFQALKGEKEKAVEKLILTASGGPFRGSTAQNLAEVTVEEALNHPNWDMGGKITIDSATLMNKGLEVIEAKWLFGVDFDDIEVVVHPQSIIHSLVQFRDNSILAELGIPDMKVPIQYVLTYPERVANNWERLDLAEVATLDFEKPDYELFPCLNYAYEAGKRGGTLPAVLNAANEIAVASFLAGDLKFIEIPKLIKRVMNAHQVISQPDLQTILNADKWARAQSQKEVEAFC